MALTQVQGGMLAGSTNTTTTIQSNGTTAITIDSSQNVGIGTSSPGLFGVSSGKLLNVVASTGYAYLQLQGTASNGGAIDFGDSTVRSAEIASLSGSALVFYTNPTNSGNGLTERMRITSGGQVGIGQNPTSYAQLQILFDATTAANNSLGIGISPVANTSNANFLQFYNATGNSCGNVTRNGTSNAVLYNTSSDYRLKENINPMTGALAKVKLLKPVTWTWIEGKQAGEGFIAHELQEVIPFAVTGQKDEMQTYVDSEGVEKTRPKYQGLDASYLVATLTAAIQELNAKVEAQAAEIAALKAAP